MKRIVLALAAAAVAFPAAAQDRSDRAAVENKMRGIKITLDFKDAPLATAIEYLREISDINFVIDAKVAEKNANVTIKVSDISLRSALTLILNPLEAAPHFKEGVVMIMLKSDIQDQTIKLELYDCRDILHPIRHFPGVDIQLSQDNLGTVAEQGLEGDPNSEINLEEIIKNNTGGKNWDETKTACRLQNGILVVKQSPEVHREVIRLLNMLRRNK
jgi:type II secretory pathway component GspD/PulD (secretin)